MTSGQTVSLKKTLTRFSNNMLVRVILLPSIFTAVPEDKTSFYTLAIKLLQELEKTGVILVDDKNCIKTTLSQGVGKWPEKFRIPGQKLLKQLWKKSRFVEVSLSGGVQPICEKKSCQYCIKIAKDYLPLAVLARQECNPCAEKQLAEVPTVKVVDVDEYSIDDSFCSHLNERGRILGNGEWEQNQFEKQILIPLFRDAKHVKIYDRWIGRSILTKNADKYKLTLAWIIDVFQQYSRFGKAGIFEVYSGFYTRNSPSEESSAVAAFRKLEADMQRAHPNFKLIIKKETKSQLPHDRYLITNQVAVSIDRGLDLLLDSRKSPYPRRLRDIHVVYCLEAGKIEKAVRLLPDL